MNFVKSTKIPKLEEFILAIKFEIYREKFVQNALQHTKSYDKILSKNEFVKQLLEKSEKLNIYNELDQNQSKTIFKPFLHKLDKSEKDIYLIFASKRDSIKRISDDLTSYDNKFISLINKDLNPMESSQQELDFLVDFLQSNLFNEWINIKKKISCVIQKAGQFLEELIQYLFKTSHLIGEIYNLYTFQKTEEKIKTLE